MLVGLTSAMLVGLTSMLTGLTCSMFVPIFHLLLLVWK